jgi:hypothetical protein
MAGALRRLTMAHDSTDEAAPVATAVMSHAS